MSNLPAVPATGLLAPYAVPLLSNAIDISSPNIRLCCLQFRFWLRLPLGEC